MQYSIVAIAGLAAVALASPNPNPVERRAVPASVSSSILAEISSLEAGLLPPASIASELTGVPPAVTSALVDPVAFSAVQASIISNGIPGWFSSLPADAKSYVLGVPGPLSSVQAVVSSLQAQLTGVSNGTAAPTGNLTITSTAKSSTATAYSNSSITSTKSSTGTTKAATTITSAATTSKPASTSSSKAGAAPTGVIAAGAMGVVGFFGLALAL